MKVVVIGGGSSYTPELIEGIILHKESLPVTEIVLIDVEAGQENGNRSGSLFLLRHGRGLWQIKPPADRRRGQWKNATHSATPRQERQRRS